MTNITSKIAAILAKAESSEFEGEASVFLAKAESLMQQHGVDLLDIECVDDPIEVEFQSTKVSGNWQADLFNAVALYFGVSTVSHVTRTYNGTSSSILMSMSGKQSARETTKVMWPYILKSVTKQAQSMIKEDSERQDSIKRSIEEIDKAIATNNYMSWSMKRNRKLLVAQKLTLPKAKKQIALALTIEIHRSIRGREAIGSTKNALVVVDASRAALEDAFPNLKTAARRSSQISEAAMSKAKNISLNHQTGGSQKTVLAIT